MMAVISDKVLQSNVSMEKEIAILQRIQDRLLWLSMQVIHHANYGRPNPEKMKVGGHPASCASAVSILTALYFSFMKASDRIAVKPHASPVLHAAMYLLGALPRESLMTLRAYGGLQAYPSRTKDVDIAVGSRLEMFPLPSRERAMRRNDRQTQL